MNRQGGILIPCLSREAEVAGKASRSEAFIGLGRGKGLEEEEGRLHWQGAVRYSCATPIVVWGVGGSNYTVLPLHWFNTAAATTAAALTLFCQLHCTYSTVGQETPTARHPNTPRQVLPTAVCVPSMPFQYHRPSLLA